MAARVFVTGARRGIGKAIAARYAAAGYEVVAPGREALDLAEPEAIRAWLAREGELAVDVLVHCAGINPVAPISALAWDDWRQTIDTNLTAAYLLIQAAAPGMAARGCGRIVAVSSLYGFLAREGRAAYAASKAGLGGLVRTAALEFAPGGVLVNAVAPGFVDTDMTRRNNPPERIRELERQVPLGRLASCEEIAEAVYFLGSTTNRYITGQTLVVDGGFSIR